MARYYLCDFFVAFLCVACVSPALGITGFRNGNPSDPRRQISYTQQGHILSDVQQHQHRFSINQNGQQQPIDFIPQPAALSPNQLPPFSQGPLFGQAPPFQPLPTTRSFGEPQIVIEPPRNTQQFLAQNALSQLPQFQQNLPSIQQNPRFFSQTPQVNGHQVPLQPSLLAPTSTQQLPFEANPTQNSFLPTIPTQTPTRIINNFEGQRQQIPQQQNNVLVNPSSSVASLRNEDIAFQSNFGNNPLFSSTQNSQLQAIFEAQRQADLERLKELQERQKIIQKHQQFLERQQQKQQQKVKVLHDDFEQKQKKKQQEIFATARPETDFTQNTQARPRPIFPHEAGLFEKALKHYESLHPTTTPLTTTTTEEPTTTQKIIIKNRNRQKAKSRSEGESQELYLQENRQKIYKELKSALQNSQDSKESRSNPNLNKLQLLPKEDLLKQLKLAIAENSQDFAGKNFTSREISLPNGQKFEVIKTTDPNLISGATPLSGDSSSLSQIFASQNQIRGTKSKVSFDDITKDVIPPGADYEIIRQGGNGKLEDISKIPPNLVNQKKVTFVFLEEQDDGSFKVKGVKGNGEETKDGPEVENILKKIKDGEIQLPPPVKKPKPTRTSSTTKKPYIAETTRAPKPTPSRTIEVPLKSDSTYQSFEATKISSPITKVPNYFNSPSPSSLSINHNGSPTPSTPLESSTKAYASKQRERTTYTKSPSTSTVNGHQMYTTRGQFDFSSASSSVSGQTVQYSPTPSISSPTPTYPSSKSGDTISILPSSSSYYPTTNIVARSTTPRPVPEAAGSQLSYSTNTSPGIIDILKENGLFATAKYLRQSGLDSILNETGPYTVFAPTDKAFRTLLIQLGGPDKAEEKFKENPRLLSGLLLHHVIPGAFEISSLQDEMTGVSLAGTQLRVNQYAMHDVEWNEIKVNTSQITTINGARVISEKQDINIPQGIAHAVDRVMFPLPVGDIIQTLQADRERRFTNFLKALTSSGMADTLSDSRTYTVFAPTDRAFSNLKSDELEQLVSNKDSAKDLVMRHISPGTLFSAGMRYYQVKDSMEEGKPITLQKNAGRIKVNSGHVITHNIPTTNGVIHAIDTLL